MSILAIQGMWTMTGLSSILRLFSVLFCVSFFSNFHPVECVRFRFLTDTTPLLRLHDAGFFFIVGHERWTFGSRSVSIWCFFKKFLHEHKWQINNAQKRYSEDVAIMKRNPLSAESLTSVPGREISVYSVADIESLSWLSADQLTWDGLSPKHCTLDEETLNTHLYHFCKKDLRVSGSFMRSSPIHLGNWTLIWLFANKKAKSD